MSPHQERVILEKTELDEKINKLHTFIMKNPVFFTLPHEEQERLRAQELAMDRYSLILGERIRFFINSLTDEEDRVRILNMT